jgi:hypothetical protein
MSRALRWNLYDYCIAVFLGGLVLAALSYFVWAVW